MNVRQILQQFERDYDSTNASAVRRWFCALTVSLNSRRAGKRRPTGPDGRQFELLEARQVLSVANLALPAIDALAPNSDFTNSVSEETLPATDPTAADSSQPGQTDDGQASASAWLGETSGNDDLRPPIPAGEEIDSGTAGSNAAGSDAPGSEILNSSFDREVAVTVAVTTAPQHDFRGVSESIDLSAALIDEVFSHGQSILENSFSSTSGTKPSVTGNLFPAPKPTNDQFDVVPASSSDSISQGFLLAASSPFILPGAAPSPEELVDIVSLVQDDWNDRPSFNESFASLPAGSGTHQKSDQLTGTPTVKPESGTSVSSAEISEVNATWFKWLTAYESGAWDSPIQSVDLSSLSNGIFRDSRPLLHQSSSPSPTPEAAAANLQMRARKFRENHRQIAVLNHAGSVDQEVYEPPQLLEISSIPWRLRFFVNPRGPPDSFPDSCVPIAETNAPADLLERLRYSIAPRGPSLVTVEMQSPEFLSFSGPRMSPQELRCELVC